jgi:hypothetical protein
MQIIRCVVPALNNHGEPDLFFVRVRAEASEIEKDKHYEAAAKAADNNGYDAGNIVFDEYDNGGPRLMSLFEWDTASIVDLEGEEIAVNS